MLIVDDDEGVCLLFGKILEYEGYVVRVATSAVTGLEEAAQDPPDAILLDFRMPLINGLGFLYRLRADPVTRDTPVAVITGDVSLPQRDWSQLEDLGADIWFKPLSPDNLVDVAKRLVARSPGPHSRRDQR